MDSETEFQLIENQVKTYAEAMTQCQSYVIAFKIHHSHDSKKRKHDKKEHGQNHSQKVHKDEPQARRDRGYPPHHQGPPLKMGPPRPKHIYVTEEEPRARNLRDGEMFPGLIKLEEKSSMPSEMNSQCLRLPLHLWIAATITYGVIITGNTATLEHNAKSLNVFCINWPRKGKLEGL